MTFARICLAQLPPQASLILRTSCVSKEKKAHAKSAKEVWRDMRYALVEEAMLAIIWYYM